MKFGRLLELKAIVEWREHYLSYKKLKRITKQLKLDEDSEIAPDSPPKSSPTQLESAVPMLSPRASTLCSMEDTFNNLLEEDLHRINSHVKSQRRTIEKRMVLLAQQKAMSVIKVTPNSMSYNKTKSAIDDDVLSSAYCDCARLRSYVQLNHEGIRKIVKKLDKHAGGEPRQPSMIARLAQEPFYVSMHELDEWVAELERLCGHPEAVRRLRVTAKRSCSPEAAITVTPRWGAMGLSAAVSLVLTLVYPLIDAEEEQHVHERRCASVLVGIIMLWLTEALPYFVTAMLVPVLVVVGRVIPEAADSSNGTLPRGTMPANGAAKLLLSAMFGSPIILLVLSGLVAAAVVSRCQLELRLAGALRRRLGRYPQAFLQVIMQLGLATSMCISNVTAPILLLAVITPLLRELPTGSRYGKALTLGLAFSCNLGGMLTPIASPQNAVALQALSNVGAKIGFGTWLAAALPIAELGLLLVHGLLLLLLRPLDCVELPLIYVDEKHRLTWRHTALLVCVLATTLLWATLSFEPLHATFGDPAIVGLAFVAIAFGSGFLTKEDFNGLAWHLLALIGGGNALGLAVSKSGLLTLASSSLLRAQHAIGGGVWLLTLELLSAMLVLTSFVSHTVAAIVTMPLIASIGASAGAPAQIVFCCALTCSAAMALPMSSFPNVNSLLAEDDYGRAYLSATDFVKIGLPASVLVSALAATLAFWLIGMLL